ncbi:MAG: pyridoxamine 5'-phosphate oxidase family protein [Armatimonadota bacterium]
MDNIEIKSIIDRLLSSQMLAVLATCSDDHPYTSLVAFTASSDLKKIYFATFRSTRKFVNLIHNARISMLIDNRSNQQSDFLEGIAVTVIGSVNETAKDEAAELFLQKHPDLKDFIDSSDTALMEVRVERYLLVSKFQNTMELNVSE